MIPIFLLLGFPLAAAAVPGRWAWLRGIFVPGVLAVCASLGILLSLLKGANGTPEVFSLHLLTAFAIDFNFQLGLPRLIFLVVAHLALMLSYLLLETTDTHVELLSRLLLSVQALLVVFVLSGNFVVCAAVLLAIAFLFYFCLAFARGADNPEAMGLARSFLYVYTACGALLLTWALVIGGISVPSAGGDLQSFVDLSYDQLHAGRGRWAIWILGAAFVLSLPLAPWGRWFSRAFDILPESLTVALVTFVSAVVFGFVLIAQSIIDEGMARHRPLFMALGVITAFFALIDLSHRREKRAMLATMPKLLWAVVLVALSLATRSSYRAAYLICLVLPALSGLLLYFTSIGLERGLQRILHFVFLFCLLGLPATPLFSVFGLIGEPALALGVGYALALAILWFMYFMANVHVWKTMYFGQHAGAPGTGASARRERSIGIALYAGVLIIALFLMPWIVRTYL